MAALRKMLRKDKMYKNAIKRYFEIVSCWRQYNSLNLRVEIIYLMTELNIADCLFIYRNYSDILIDSFEIIQIVVGNGCGSLVRL